MTTPYKHAFARRSTLTFTINEIKVAPFRRAIMGKKTVLCGIWPARDLKDANFALIGQPSDAVARRLAEMRDIHRRHRIIGENREFAAWARAAQRRLKPDHRDRAAIAGEVETDGRGRVLRHGAALTTPPPKKKAPRAMSLAGPKSERLDLGAVCYSSKSTPK